MSAGKDAVDEAWVVGKQGNKMLRVTAWADASGIRVYVDGHVGLHDPVRLMWQARRPLRPSETLESVDLEQLVRAASASLERFAQGGPVAS